MANLDPKDYQGWLNNLHDWLKTTQENEVKKMGDFFERGSLWLAAAKDLSQDEWELMTRYFKRDLSAFYDGYQQEFASSNYVQLLKEGVWSELAELTDKSQIEWQELLEDFKHNGDYKAGEWVGMGELICQNCKHTLEVVHPIEVPVCSECGHNLYFREALAP